MWDKKHRLKIYRSTTSGEDPDPTCKHRFYIIYILYTVLIYAYPIQNFIFSFRINVGSESGEFQQGRIRILGKKFRIIGKKFRILGKNFGSQGKNSGSQGKNSGSSPLSATLILDETGKTIQLGTVTSRTNDIRYSITEMWNCKLLCESQ